MSNPNRFPLAHDAQCQPIEVPAEATSWRVRRSTKGRPAYVYSRSGAPLVVPIDATAEDLQAEGVGAGTYRLDALDLTGRPIGLLAYTEIAATEAEDASGATLVSAPPQDVVRIVESATRALEGTHRASMDAMARVMESMQKAQAERANADSQVTLALARRVGGPVASNDPLEIIRQVGKVQKVIAEQHAHLVPPPALALGPSDEGAPSKGDTAKAWVGVIVEGLGRGAAGALVDRYPAIRNVVGTMFGGCGTEGQDAEGTGANPASAGPAGTLAAILGSMSEPERDALNSLFASVPDTVKQALLRSALSVPVDDAVTFLRALLKTQPDAAPAAAAEAEGSR